MKPYVNIRDQYCPNVTCKMHGEVMRGNVVVHGKKRARLKCKTCGTTWAAYRDEIRYGFRSDPQKIEVAIALLGQGRSIRNIAHHLGVSPGTIQRWKNQGRKKGIL